MTARQVAWVAACAAAVGVVGAGRAQAKCAFEWARHFAGDYQNAVDVEAMPDGGYAVAGTMVRDLRLFGGEARPRRLRARGEQDVFVARLSGDGRLLWVRAIGGGAGSRVSAGVTVRADGTLLVHGSYRGAPALLGADDRPVVTLPPSGKTTFGHERQAAFIAAYSPEGVPRVLATGTGTGDQGVSHVAFVGDDLVLLGSYRGKLQIGGAGPAIESRGGEDAWLARLRPDGSAAWATTLGGPGNDWSGSVAATPGGAIFVSGTFEDSGVPGVGPPSPPGALFGTARPVRLRTVGKTDLFLARYDAGGEVVWATRLGGKEGDDIDDRELESGLAGTADGAILFAGRMPVPGDLGAGNPPLAVPGEQRSSFVARFDAGGRLQWVAPGGAAYLRGPQVLPGGDFVVSGFIDERVRYPAAGPTQLTLTPTGRDDAFIARHDPAGRLRWATRIGGNGHAQGDAVVGARGLVGVALYFKGDLSLEDDGGCAPMRVRGSERSYNSLLVRLAPDAALATQDRERRLAAVDAKVDAARAAARAAYAAKSYALAVTRYREVTGLAPEDPAAWTDLGVALMRAGRKREAVEANQRALALASRDREVDDSAREAHRRHAYFNLYKLGERLAMPEEGQCRALPAPHGCARTMWACVKTGQAQGSGGGSTWQVARLAASKDDAEFDADEEIADPDMSEEPPPPEGGGPYVARPGTWFRRESSVDVLLERVYETRCPFCSTPDCNQGCEEGEEVNGACQVVAADACHGVVGIACTVEDGKPVKPPGLRERCVEPAPERR